MNLNVNTVNIPLCLQCVPVTMDAMICQTEELMAKKISNFYIYFVQINIKRLILINIDVKVLKLKCFLVIKVEYGKGS